MSECFYWTLEGTKEYILKALNDARLARLEELKVYDCNPFSPASMYDQAAAWAHIPTNLLKQCSHLLRRLGLYAIFLQKHND